MLKISISPPGFWNDVEIEISICFDTETGLRRGQI